MQFSFLISIQVIFMCKHKKKLMILEKGIARIRLAAAARAEGYEVYLCDQFADQVDASLVDHRICIHFEDKDAILEKAREIGIDGIISNEEYSMPVVAYVAEQMGLPGNHPDSVEVINDKHKFRALQKKLGLFAPENVVSESFEELLEKARGLTFPIVIKPNRSQGSLGTTVIQSIEELEGCRKLWEFCADCTPDHCVDAEEYVDMSDSGVYVEGDIFIAEGKVLYFLETTTRSKRNPKIVMTDNFPPDLTEEQLESAKAELDILIKGSGTTHGQFNIEMYQRADGSLFTIEFNSRQGGFNTPQEIKNYCGVDTNRMLVMSAVGDYSYFSDVYESMPIQRITCRMSLLPFESGVFKGVHIAEEIRPYVTEITMVVKEGALVGERNNPDVISGIFAGNVLAFVDMEFTSRDERALWVRDIEQFIYPEIE